jgi:hypothetical protein
VPLPQGLQDEFRRAGDVEATGAALARYAESLSPGEFKLEGERWVYRPLNFVTFQVQKKQPVVVMTFSGYPRQFETKAEEAGLTKEWRSLSRTREYSACKITNPGQLLAASQFIKWGFEYKTRSKSRARPAAKVQPTKI